MYMYGNVTINIDAYLQFICYLVISCRDMLKTKVDRLTSGIQSTPDFGFKFKAGASVVESNISSSGHRVPSLTNGSTPHSDNVSETSNSGMLSTYVMHIRT